MKAAATRLEEAFRTDGAGFGAAVSTGDAAVGEVDWPVGGGGPSNSSAMLRVGWGAAVWSAVVLPGSAVETVLAEGPR